LNTNNNNRERIKSAKTIQVNKNKSRILEHILRSPGVRYRQLLRFTGLSIEQQYIKEHEDKKQETG
jgi:hypothetical protein